MNKQSGHPQQVLECLRYWQKNACDVPDRSGTRLSCIIEIARLLRYDSLADRLERSSSLLSQMRRGGLINFVRSSVPLWFEVEH